MTISLAFVFAAVFTAGWWVMQSSWDGRTSINVAQLNKTTLSRDPAAIRKVYDFSTLKGGALASASKRRLLLGSEVVSEGERVGVQFGHFVVGGPKGERVFACSRYARLEMTFEAEGFAVSGERPKMIVTGNCRVSADINKIEPIWLPVDRITAEEPGNLELEFLEQDRVTVRFENLIENWPNSWELKEVRMVNESSHADAVTIDGEEIRRYTGQPFSMQW